VRGRLSPRLAAAALATLCAVAAAAESDPRELELQALRRAIEQHRQRVAGFERQERGLLETVEEMDQAIEALARDAARARREAADARAQSERLAAEARTLEASLARTRRSLSQRAVALYKAGDLGPVAALFGAASLRDALERAALLQRLIDGDQRLLRRFRSEQAALAEASAGAERAERAREVALARLETRSREVERERGARAATLAAVRGDRRRERAALNELEAAARALEETLAHLQREPLGREAAPGAVPFATLRGALAPPVEAPVVARFGKVRDEFGTEIVRKGVEFAARAGDPVRGVADGVVRFAGWFRGYGKIVIVDHGDDYFTVSGHLEEIAVSVGERVERGSPLGSAGATGSLEGPRLYFEIRRGGQALDPADWLRSGARGQALDSPTAARAAGAAPPAAGSSGTRRPPNREG
jgi:septal ring factor EnvC (AmiA/AmiB activator)